MTTNATYTPPNYSINFTPVYKDTLVYMTTYDTCYICIGNADNGKLTVKERYIIQRQNDNSWRIVGHDSTEYNIDGVTNEYYTYSNYLTGAQMPSQYYYKQMGFYAKGLFILMIAYIIGKAVLRIISR